MQVSGEFEVNLKPLDPYAESKDGCSLGRMSIDKTFKGDLDATSQGEMLTAMTSVKGSAGYVAIEQVSGSLEGKEGSFILQHFGTMIGETSRLILEVVPDSGTRELKGLNGSMKIIRKEGKHFYEFDYSFDSI